MRLTNQERETIINYNMAEGTAFVYSANPREWRHFEKLGVKPTEVRKDSNGVVYAKDYEVPKKWVKLPKPPKQVSEKQREAARKTMAKLHQGKPQEIGSAG